MNKLRWGVLSTARIGREKVIPAMQGAEWCDVQAIASRTPGRAREVADALGIAKAYDSYEALLADPEIEAIYNPLPNEQHVPWTLRAAAAGKHVLCEKPVAMDAAEARALRAAASQVHIAEAFMVRHHPQWLRVRTLLRDGAIGRLRAVQGTFSYGIHDPANIRNQAAIGGGGLYDIGSYLVAMSRFAFAAEPDRVAVLMDRDPGFGTDRLTTALIELEGGHAALTCGTQLKFTQNMLLVGTEGWIRLDTPFAVTPDHACRIMINRAAHTGRLPEYDMETLPAVDHYALMVADFADRVRRGDTARDGLRSGIANMRVLDALHRAADTRVWESVAPPG